MKGGEGQLNCPGARRTKPNVPGGEGSKAEEQSTGRKPSAGPLPLRSGLGEGLLAQLSHIPFMPCSMSDERGQNATENTFKYS